MKDLTTGSEVRAILLFSLPMLAGNVFQQFYNTVDAIIVGNVLGKQALAAVGAAFPVLFLIVALIMGITMGATIIISQYFGAKDLEKVRQAIDTTWVVLLWTAGVLTIGGLFASGPILQLLNTPAEILADATIYLQIIFGGIVLLFGYNSVSAVLRGLGDSTTPLVFLIIATVLNVGLDLLFVLVFGWGVAGVAIATVLAQGLSFIGSVWWLNRTHQVLRIRLRGLKFDRAMFERSLKIGLPSGVQQVLVAAGMMALVSVVNSFGTNAIAAFSAASRIDAFAIMPCMNISMAVSAFTGQNIGAGKVHRVRRGFLAGLGISAIISLVLTAVVVAFGPALIAVFNTDPEVVRIGADYLAIIGSFYVVVALMFTATGVLRGAGDTLVPMFFTLAALWVVRIPLAYVLAPRWGTTGIWWAIPSGFTVGAVLSFGYYLGGRWKKKALVQLHEQTEG